MQSWDSCAARRAVIGVVVAAMAVLCPLGATATAGTTGSVTGSVWNDVNRNAVFDAGESPFVGIPIDVYSGSSYVTGAYTDSSGAYQVANLPPGTYTIEIDPSTWRSMRDSWALTTMGSSFYQGVSGDLAPMATVSLTSSARADFGLRQIVRSTTWSSPVTSYTGPNGLRVDSYDDVVAAQTLYDDVMAGVLVGPEAKTTVLYFDSPTSGTYTAASIGGSGPYCCYSASMYVAYDTWVTLGDVALFHEWGVDWGDYNAYITQADPSYSAYLSARGLSGNPSLGTSAIWQAPELLAEDYRQLFGTANAASYPQNNTQIPPASEVPGLETFLASTYDVPAFVPPAPTVSSLGPSAVPEAGGTQVSVTGTNFEGSGWVTTAVRVGGTSVPFTVVSATQLLVTLPPGTGQDDITVTVSATSDGASVTSAASSSDVVSYVPVPTVTSITPTSGSLKGGTLVTVFGTGFTGPGFTVSTVSLGGVAAAQVVVVSPTELSVVTPPSTSSVSVPVTVTTAGGTSVVTASAKFSYVKSTTTSIATKGKKAV